jgi:hypothetical protein
MYLDLSGYLDMGYKVEVNAAFISDPNNEDVLRYGTRATLWRVDDLYKRISEAEKPEDAFNALITGLRNPVRQPFINRYEDGEIVRTIEPSDPNWSLSVYSPNMRDEDLPDSFTYRTHPNAISGEFQLIKSKSGDCKVLYFEGRNDILEIQPRALVTLVYDDEAVFYGPAVFHPSSRNSTPGSIKVLGSRENLDGYLINKPLQGRFSIQEFIEEITGQMFKGPVSYNAAKIRVPALFVELDHQVIGLPMSTLLDELVLKLPNGRWGVDADGELFLHT